MLFVKSLSLLQPFSAHQNQAATASSSGDPLTDAPGNHKPHPPHEGKKVSSKKRNISRSPSPSGGGDHPKKRRTSRDSNGSDNEKKMGEPSIFTFDTSQMHPSQHMMPPPPILGGATQEAGTMTGATSQGVVVGSKGATLDDLCRAVEALEKMENGGAGQEDDDDKRRPGNIRIPTHSSPSLDRDRHRLGSTPPYTPPPILSPARSMALLSAVPGTPSRILQPWTSRRSTDYRKPSEAEEGGGYLEPKINVGRQFQAVLPQCCEWRECVSRVYVCYVYIPTQKLQWVKTFVNFGENKFREKAFMGCTYPVPVQYSLHRRWQYREIHSHETFPPVMVQCWLTFTCIIFLHPHTQPQVSCPQRRSTRPTRCGNLRLILWRTTRTPSMASWSWPAPPPCSTPGETRSTLSTSCTLLEAL